jgi:hypothetical protein
VLVLNSIRLKSLAVGFVSGLPNIDSILPAHKPRNEFVLGRMDIF